MGAQQDLYDWCTRGLPPCLLTCLDLLCRGVLAVADAAAAAAAAAASAATARPAVSSTGTLVDQV